MYVQVRTIRNTKYVYIVENRRRKSDGKIVRKTVERLGRLDKLEENNPNYLSDLKEQLVKKGEIVKAEQTVYNKIILKDTNSEKDNYCGYPFVYYSNFPIRIIYRDIMQLTYYFKYLQKTKYPALKFNLERFMFHQILITLIPDVITKNTPNAFINESFDLDKEKKDLKKAKEILFSNHKRFMKFLKAREKEMYSFFKDLYLYIEEHLKTKGIQEFNASSYFTFFKTAIKEQILSYIKGRLKDKKLNCSFRQIEDALNNARLIKLRPIEETINTNVYIKIAHKSIKLMDLIMTLTGFEAIENAQVEKELYRKLGLRSDRLVFQDKSKDILEEEHYEAVVEEEPKEDKYAAARSMFFI